MLTSALFVRSYNFDSLVSIRSYKKLAKIRINFYIRSSNLFIRLIEDNQQLKCDYIIPGSINHWCTSDTDLILDPNRYLELLN